MSVYEHISVIGSIFVLIFMGTAVINSKWDDFIPMNFIVAVGTISVALVLMIFFNGIITFGQWIFNLLK